MKWKKFKEETFGQKFTIMLLPHSRQKPIHFKVPGWGLGLAFCLAACFVGVSIYLACSAADLGRISGRLHELEAEKEQIEAQKRRIEEEKQEIIWENTQLKGDTAQQEQMLRDLEGKAEEAIQELGHLYERENELRAQAGLEAVEIPPNLTMEAAEAADPDSEGQEAPPAPEEGGTAPAGEDAGTDMRTLGVPVLEPELPSSGQGSLGPVSQQSLAPEAHRLAAGGSGDSPILPAGGSGGSRILAAGGSEGSRILAAGGSEGSRILAAGGSEGSRILAAGGSEGSPILPAGGSEGSPILEAGAAAHTATPDGNGARAIGLAGTELMPLRTDGSGGGPVTLPEPPSPEEPGVVSLLTARDTAPAFALQTSGGRFPKAMVTQALPRIQPDDDATEAQAPGKSGTVGPERDGLARNGTGQAVANQSGLAPAGIKQDEAVQPGTGPNEAVQAGIKPNEAVQPETGPNEAVQAGSRPIETGKGGTKQSRTGQPETRQDDETRQDEIGQSGTGSDGTGQSGTEQAEAGQGSGEQTGTRPAGAGQGEIGKEQAGQDVAGQHEASQTGTDQTGSEPCGTGQDQTGLDAEEPDMAGRYGIGRDGEGPGAEPALNREAYVVERKLAVFQTEASRKNQSYNDLSRELAEAARKEALVKAAQNRRQKIVDYALQFVGNSYVWGGNDPHTGVDCSGFTKYVLNRMAGVDLPRTAATQYNTGRTVSIDEARPGDLVFYSGNGYINHVAMYIGDGKVVHAASRKSGIKVSSWDYRRPVRIKNVVGD